MPDFTLQRIDGDGSQPWVTRKEGVCICMRERVVFTVVYRYIFKVVRSSFTRSFDDLSFPAQKTRKGGVVWVNWGDRRMV